MYKSDLVIAEQSEERLDVFVKFAGITGVGFFKQLF